MTPPVPVESTPPALSPPPAMIPKKAPAKSAAAKPAKKASLKKKEPLALTSPKLRGAGKKAAPVKEKEVAAKETHKKEAHHPAVSGIRIRLSAFDHRVLDEAAAKILDTALRSGAVVHGPIPLPTILRKFTVNKSTFVHKNARDQFEMRIHRRLIDLTETTFKTVESLQSLSLPSGVDIEIKMK